MTPSRRGLLFALIGGSVIRPTLVAPPSCVSMFRQEGRTPNRTTQGTGNPHRPLEERSVQELRNLAAQKKVAGRSHMKKADLIGM